MDSVNILKGLSKISEYWDPHMVAEVNDHDIKVAKFKGAFDMHHHDNTDELFYVLKGTMKMEMEGETKVLNEGDVLVIPQGVRHRPVAEEEAHILLIERRGTVNTGNVVTDKTRTNLKSI